MPRDADALLIRKWAESGDVATPESQGLARATGWPVSYSQPGGDTPEREVFNQMFREITAMLAELNTHGVLEWDDAINYDHPALVVGSDDLVYISVQDSLNQDPTTDTGDTYWALLLSGLAASVITSGTFAIARIPSLPASQTTSGEFAVARIPNLSAGKVTSGTLGTARIPNLAASKITSGTFVIARIPDLSAGKITSGTFAYARFPDRIRETYLSDDPPDPSDGNDGDIWLEY